MLTRLKQSCKSCDNCGGDLDRGWIKLDFGDDPVTGYRDEHVFCAKCYDAQLYNPEINEKLGLKQITSEGIPW